MHKCGKSDAESTEKAASSNEDENYVHVKTEASRDCKSEVSYFNSIIYKIQSTYRNSSTQLMELYVSKCCLVAVGYKQLCLLVAVSYINNYAYINI